MNKSVSIYSIMNKIKLMRARALRWGVTALLLFVVSVMAKAYDFSAVNDDGKTIYYNILSSSDKTCAVTYGGTSYSSALYSGSVNIPETVTYNGITYSVPEIGEYAFYRCSGLTSVTIPNSVTEIGYYAFRNCTGLTEVNFNAIACNHAGSSVISTEDITFSGCDNISTFNFGDNVTIIPNYLCYRMTSLKNITIGNSVTTIGISAFYGCTGLTGTLTIPEGVTSIGNYAFYNCTSLRSELVIPKGVTSIGSYAFYSCRGLTGTLTLPNSVTEIGSYAFYNCSGLTGALTIPEGVTEIGDCTFMYCSGLTGVLTIPDGVTTIGYDAFAYCSGLTGELIIPNGVTTIGDDAFKNCSGLTSATIGYRVTSIGNYAFSGTILEKIYSKNLTPPYILEDTFYKVDKNTCILYVPVNSKNAYSTADYWSEFINIEEMNFDDVLIVQTYEATEVTTSSALLRGVVTVGDEEVLEQGFEYWAEGEDVQTITSPDLIMAVTLTGLEDGVTYTYRAYATTGSGTSYSEEMTFTTIKAPTVQTYEVTEITENSALLKGYVTAGNEEVLGQGFEYWAAGGEVQTIAMSDQIMAATITGLNEGTTYTCRAYAKTASGTTYGEEVTFTTLGTAAVTPPTVLTYEATDVTENSATLSGVVAAGSEKVTEQGFEYWSSSNDVQTVASTSSMSVTVVNLKSGTTYTYRAYAKTESGTTYGNEVTFTTLTPTVTPPTVQTFAVTDVTESSAVLKGQVTAGSEDVLGQGFEYWAEGGGTQTIAMAGQSMEITLAGLEQGTTYTYRAYAITASGTTYGEELSFTTLENTDGVSDVNADIEEEARYTTDGKKVSQPQRGINIIRYSDGSAKKVLVK